MVNKKNQGNSKKRKRSAAPVEPRMYPSGIKIFEVTFDYGFDIAIPSKSTLPVAFRIKKESKVGAVVLERMEGLTQIENARTTAKTKSRTRSVRKLRKPQYLEIGLEGTNPLHYRLHNYGQITAPTFRTKVKVRFYSPTETPGGAVEGAFEAFNAFLKSYRAASGDPVPYMDKNSTELGPRYIRYLPVTNQTVDGFKDILERIKYLQKPHKFKEAGPTFGINTRDFDMAPKPYIFDVAKKTIQYGLLPDEVPTYTDTIIEAMELSHRRNQHGLGIAMLNLAFEGAILYYLLAVLFLLGNEEKEVMKIIREHRDLEDKRRVYDDFREQLVAKHNLKPYKRFRGSGEEGNWNKSTYQKRHMVIHVVDLKEDEDSEITMEHFRKALEDTQKAIALLKIDIEGLRKEIRGK